MLIATFQGVSHDILYSRLGSTWARWNEHIIFNIERCLWGVLAIGSIYYGMQFKDIIEALPKVVCYACGSFCSFSFFHNGGYGMAFNYRKYGTINLKYWSYTSTTDTARISLDFQSRLWWFLLLGIPFIITGQFVIKID
jgi:hypothetical protein